MDLPIWLHAFMMVFGSFCTAFTSWTGIRWAYQLLSNLDVPFRDGFLKLLGAMFFLPAFPVVLGLQVWVKDWDDVARMAIGLSGFALFQVSLPAFRMLRRLAKSARKRLIDRPLKKLEDKLEAYRQRDDQIVQRYRELIEEYCEIIADAWFEDVRSDLRQCYLQYLPNILEQRRDYEEELPKVGALVEQQKEIVREQLLRQGPNLDWTIIEEGDNHFVMPKGPAPPQPCTFEQEVLAETIALRDRIQEYIKVANAQLESLTMRLDQLRPRLVELKHYPNRKQKFRAELGFEIQIEKAQARYHDVRRELGELTMITEIHTQTEVGSDTDPDLRRRLAHLRRQRS